MTKKTENQTFELVRTILDFLGIDAEVKITETSDQIGVEIDSQSAGLIIGRKGMNLQSFERVLQVLLYSLTGEHRVVSCDVAGFRQKRVKFIEELTNAAIEEALRSNRPKTLTGLTAAERKTVHLKLANHPKLTSESQGAGFNRVLIIKPKE